MSGILPEEIIFSDVYMHILNAGIRGTTCHEIAEALKLSYRVVGRNLDCMKTELEHLNNQRDGEYVFRLNGED